VLGVGVGVWWVRDRRAGVASSVDRVEPVGPFESVPRLPKDPLLGGKQGENAERLPLFVIVKRPLPVVV